VLIIAGGLLNTATESSAAEGFLVQSALYVDDARDPASRNTTMFRRDLVFDFLGDGDEITLLDQARGRVIMLDPARELKSEITTDQILQINEQLRQWAGRRDDPLLKFAVDPKFDVAQGANDKLVLSASVLTYEVATGAESEPIVSQYRRFSDWYARLNSTLNPGALPPFARLVVNSHLASRNKIPRQVTLTISAQPRFGNRDIRLRTTHHFRHGLTGSDLERIEKAQRYLVTLRNVPLNEYRRSFQTAKR
jgi:hypothetical protein